MRTIAIAALFASAAWGQTAQRTLRFGATETVQEMQEIATAVTSMTDRPDSSIDTVQRTLLVSGTPAQVAATEWVFQELDKPANRKPVAEPDPVVHEYRISGTDENIIRVFYLANTTTVQDFQELATLIRSIGEIRRVFIYNTPRALVLRGTAPQIAMAETLVRQLDQPSTASEQRPRSGPEFRVPGSSDDIVRVFYVKNAASVQEFQEVATAIRATVEIRRLFTYNRPRAVALRASADQVAAAGWLFDALDQRSGAGTGPQQYEMPGTAEGVVRVFYLPDTPSVAAFQQTAKSLREATGIRRVFTYNAPRALVLRGTAPQIALAAQVIAQRDPAVAH
jgi:hypothetical protein